MFDIKRNADNQSWLINPPRKKFELAESKENILAEFKSSRMNIVCPFLDGDYVYASFGTSKGDDNKVWDFALKYRLEHGVTESSIYIESQNDRDGMDGLYLVVVLDEGEIVTDVICSSDEIFEEVTSFVVDYKSFGFEIYGLEKNVLGALGFDVDNLNIKELKKPFTESYLLKDEYLFVSPNGIQERLKPKGLLVRWVIPFLVIAAGLGYNLYEPPVDMSKQIVTETIDEYEDYKNHMLNILPQASNRFAQDFNNHLIFDETARGWEVRRVLHTNEGAVVYEMRNDSGSLRELRSIVDIVSNSTTIPAVLDISDTGNIVIFAGQNTSIFTENSVALWNVREAYELISDAITLLVPNCEVQFSGFEKRNADAKWKSMNITLDFTLMPTSQLMVLSKITKSMPVSIVNANYIQSDGMLTGNFQIQVHGDE